MLTHEVLMKLLKGTALQRYVLIELLQEKIGKEWTKQEIYERVKDKKDLKGKRIFADKAANQKAIASKHKGSASKVKKAEEAGIPTCLNERLYELSVKGNLNVLKMQTSVVERNGKEIKVATYTLRKAPKEKNDFTIVEDLSEFKQMEKAFAKFKLPLIKPFQTLIEENSDALNAEVDAFPVLDLEAPLLLDADSDHAALIYQAIREQLVLIDLEYNSHFNARGNAAAKKIKSFDPYLLKQFKGQWYLVGCESDTISPGAWIFVPINRISKLKLHPQKKGFTRKTNFKPFELWKNSLGITRYGDAMKISFKVRNGSFYNNIDYLLKNPIHTSQEIEKTPVNGWYTLKLKVHFGPELVRVIRSLGAELVKDIKPAWIAEDLKDNGTRIYINIEVQCNADQLKLLNQESSHRLRIGNEEDNEPAAIQISKHRKKPSWYTIALKNICPNSVLYDYINWLEVELGETNVEVDVNEYDL